MRKLSLLFVIILTISSCEQDSILTEMEEFSIEQDSFAKRASNEEKVDVCHKGKIINVSVNAISAHQNHGDAVDMDGDGYFNIENDCSEIDCDDDSFSEDNFCGLEIGDFHEGGIIFYLDDTSEHGLVVASNDLERSNLWDAIYQCKNSDEGGYSDWYLPTMDNLKLIYTNLHPLSLGNFNGEYWSNTRCAYRRQRYIKDLNSGTENCQWNVAYANVGVRAVRAF